MHIYQGILSGNRKIVMLPILTLLTLTICVTSFGIIYTVLKSTRQDVHILKDSGKSDRNY